MEKNSTTFHTVSTHWSVVFHCQRIVLNLHFPHPSENLCFHRNINIITLLKHAFMSYQLRICTNETIFEHVINIVHTTHRSINGIRFIIGSDSVYSMRKLITYETKEVTNKYLCTCTRYCINPAENKVQEKGRSKLMESSLDCVTLPIQVKGRGPQAETDRPIVWLCPTTNYYCDQNKNCKQSILASPWLSIGLSVRTWQI